MNKFTRYMDHEGTEIFEALIDCELPLKAVSILWICNECGGYTVQMLPDQPPARCLDCGNGKEEWTDT